MSIMRFAETWDTEAIIFAPLSNERYYCFYFHVVSCDVSCTCTVKQFVGYNFGSKDHFMVIATAMPVLLA